MLRLVHAGWLGASPSVGWGYRLDNRLPPEPRTIRHGRPLPLGRRSTTPRLSFTYDLLAHRRT